MSGVLAAAPSMADQRAAGNDSTADFHALSNITQGPSKFDDNQLGAIKGAARWPSYTIVVSNVSVNSHKAVNTTINSSSTLLNIRVIPLPPRPE